MEPDGTVACPEDDVPAEAPLPEENGGAPVPEPEEEEEPASASGGFPVGPLAIGAGALILIAAVAS